MYPFPRAALVFFPISLLHHFFGGLGKRPLCLLFHEPGLFESRRLLPLLCLAAGIVFDLEVALAEHREPEPFQREFQKLEFVILYPFDDFGSNLIGVQKIAVKDKVPEHVQVRADHEEEI